MSLRELQEAGIERVSFRPWLFRSALRHFADCVAQLADLGSYQCIALAPAPARAPPLAAPLSGVSPPGRW